MTTHKVYATFESPNSLMRGLLAIIDKDEGNNHLSLSCKRKINRFLINKLDRFTSPHNATNFKSQRERARGLEPLRVRQQEKQREYERDLERDREINRQFGERLRESQARIRENAILRQFTATATAPVHNNLDRVPFSRFHGPVNCVDSFYAPAGYNSRESEDSELSEEPSRSVRYQIETKTGQSIRTRPSRSGPSQAADTTFYWDFDASSFQRLLLDFDPAMHIASASMGTQSLETATTNDENSDTVTGKETDESTKPLPQLSTARDDDIPASQHTSTTVEQDSSIVLDDTSTMMSAESAVATIDHSKHLSTPAIIVIDFAYNTQTTVQSSNSFSSQVPALSTQDTQYTNDFTSSNPPSQSSMDCPAIDYKDDSDTSAAAARQKKSPAATTPRRSPCLAEAAPLAVAENMALGKRVRHDEAEGAKKKDLTDDSMRKLSTPKPRMRRTNRGWS